MNMLSLISYNIMYSGALFNIVGQIVGIIMDSEKPLIFFPKLDEQRAAKLRFSAQNWLLSRVCSAQIWEKNRQCL